jgi:hypothetical protein
MGVSRLFPMFMDAIEIVLVSRIGKEPSEIFSAAGPLATGLFRITSKPSMIASFGAVGRTLDFQFDAVVQRLSPESLSKTGGAAIAKVKPPIAAPVVRPTPGISRKFNESPLERVRLVKVLLPDVPDRLRKLLSVVPSET